MEIKIANTNGKPTVSSIQVAKDFEKRLSHVNEAIESLIEGCAEKSADLFIESSYQHPQNKQWYKYYEITRDGFSLLVMGFTGKKALKWKLKYIEAFNKMEQCIKSSLVKKLDSYMIEDEIERAKRWIEEAEERVRLELTVKEKEEEIEKKDKTLRQQEPFVYFAKSVANSEDCIDMNSMAKLIFKKTGLDIGRNKLLKILREHKVLMYNNQPYQRYINDGTFKLNEKPYKDCDGQTRLSIKTLVTGKGQIKICRFIQKKYGNN